MKSKNQNRTQNNSHDQDITRGLLYTHTRINANTAKTLETASFLYALIEIMNEKEVLSIDELDERKKQVAKRLVRNFVESGIGILYQDTECDKYTFEHESGVDCLSRLPVCKAICCKFPFALSKQDVEEGLIHWEFGRPYLIAHGDDGYCVHLDRETYKCTAYDHRTVPCRGFRCQDNEKWQVWLDYEKKVINPELMEQIDESNVNIYSFPELKLTSNSSTK
jgi:Fe-S-cluster containining protein